MWAKFQLNRCIGFSETLLTVREGSHFSEKAFSFVNIFTVQCDIFFRAHTGSSITGPHIYIGHYGGFLEHLSAIVSAKFYFSCSPQPFLCAVGAKMRYGGGLTKMTIASSIFLGSTSNFHRILLKE